MKLVDGDYVRDEILFGEAYVSDELAVYIKRVFDDAPTIEAEPVRHGKWIVTEEHNDIIDMDVAKYTCSACGEYRLTASGLNQATNYCPNCGAKMDGGGSDGKAD